MIKQISHGLYAFLPNGVKVLNKINSIIRREMEKKNFLEIIMPTIQPADLWKESNRYNSYGKEMLKMQDRHGKDLLYGPTHEEVASFLFKNEITSYKQMPISIYHIQWKFRDEIRPRFGLMRSREFLMLDSYSFATTEEQSQKIYYQHIDTFIAILQSLNLKPILVKTDTGPIGGDFSHELHILSDSGESEIIYDERIEDIINNPDQDQKQMLNMYAKEVDDRNTEEEVNIKTKKSKSIEVGHVFTFGTKYSKSLDVKYLNDQGKEDFPLMGSYGIGVGRLMQAMAEISRDENGIIWPTDEIAPFSFSVVNLSQKNEQCAAINDEICNTASANNENYINIDNANYKDAADYINKIGIPYNIMIRDSLTLSSFMNVVKNYIKDHQNDQITEAIQNIVSKIAKYEIYSQKRHYKHRISYSGN